MYDAVHLFTKAIRKADEELDVHSPSINCMDGSKWNFGKRIFDILVKVPATTLKAINRGLHALDSATRFSQSVLRSLTCRS